MSYVAQWHYFQDSGHLKCNLFAFSFKSAEYLQKISQGSVAPCLRWGG